MADWQPFRGDERRREGSSAFNRKCHEVTAGGRCLRKGTRAIETRLASPDQAFKAERRGRCHLPP